MGRGWSFTLRSDVSWQDVRPVTCADVTYGISRTFATTQIIGGPTHAMALLDVPRNDHGSGTYAGPYVKTGPAGLDEAVMCSGQTITCKLATPVPEFNHVVALPAFGSAGVDKDRDAGSATAIFSIRRYLLKGAWQHGAGVKDYIDGQALSGTVDLATVSLR